MEHDDLNVESLDFKPINKGLGFHQKTSVQPKKHSSLTSKLNKAQSTTQSVNVLNTSHSRIKDLNSEMGKTPINNKVQDSTNVGLKKIYNSSINDGETIVPNKSSPVVVTADPKNILSMQFFSWAIDLVFLVLTIFAIMTTAGYLVFGDIYVIYKYSILDFYTLGSVLFTIFYIFYFSILDLDKTIGSSLLQLKLVKENGSKVQFKDTIQRALFTFLSIPLFGLPFILNLPSRLSKTKVLR